MFDISKYYPKDTEEQVFTRYNIVQCSSEGNKSTCLTLGIIMPNIVDNLMIPPHMAASRQVQ